MHGRVSPVDMLLQRQRLMDDIAQVARLCSWGEDEIEHLLSQVWQSLVDIDNEVLTCALETKDEARAKAIWAQGMNDLQNWLSSALGLEVDFVF
jgi:hypothetical protein